jgi:hypothetical protein
MVTAASVMTTAGDAVPGSEAYRPAGVFISYASEDHDIAQAVYQSLQTLGETIFDRIKIFLDSKSIEGGDEISADIKTGLKKSVFSWFSTRGCSSAATATRAGRSAFSRA